MTRKARIAGLMALLAVIGVAGCTHDKEKHSMLTYQQAAETVEQLIKEHAAALNPVPRLVPRDGLQAAPCSGPNDDKDTGKVMVEHTYRLNDIDRSHNDDIFRQLRQYWSDHRYRVTLDRAGSLSRKVVARHPDNDFKVGLTEGEGVLSLTAQSSCVPDPEAR